MLLPPEESSYWGGGAGALLWGVHGALSLPLTFWGLHPSFLGPEHPLSYGHDQLVASVSFLPPYALPLVAPGGLGSVEPVLLHQPH